jgi:hypothetical protein
MAKFGNSFRGCKFTELVHGFPQGEMDYLIW